ncbi:amidase signature domain-containing protein [Hypoxylon crocopeplum]|nr:amidase signature domain-containing protein [Hypoxylon crocopeplum]
MGERTNQETWQSIAARKQVERASRIPPEWLIPDGLMPSGSEDCVQDIPYKSGFFGDRELLITNSTASDVVSKISTGEWSALEVTRAACKRAACKRAAVAQQLLNCVTEIYFEQAVSRAAELDDYFKTKGGPVGPLHGLPISLKDQFNLEGVDSTIRYVRWARKKPREESTLVKLLRDAGAVLYVKTNVPTTLMTGETVNNLFSRTLNPRNRKLTTGGSSGGESALVSFRRSFIGVGTDIGGSIRHPASYTGLYALRPSHGRVSYQQVTNTFLGQEAVKSCAGPMCRSPRDIQLFMKSLVTQKPWEYDPQIIPMPWRSEAEALLEKLCFGFGMGDGYVTPSPPLRRAIEIAKDKLHGAGHSCIDFTPYEMWLADGAEEIRRDSGLTGEPLPPSVEAIYGHSNILLEPLSVFSTWQNQQRRAILAQKFLERWQKTAESTGTGRPIDGLIMPSTPNYGVLSPLLDLTTGVFPVTRVDPKQDVIPDDWKPISDKEKEVMEFYDRPENHENALIGLALIGRRLEEEKVAAMLVVMENVVGFNEDKM